MAQALQLSGWPTGEADGGIQLSELTDPFWEHAASLAGLVDRVPETTCLSNDLDAIASLRLEIEKAIEFVVPEVTAFEKSHCSPNAPCCVSAKRQQGAIFCGNSIRKVGNTRHPAGWLIGLAVLT